MARSNTVVVGDDTDRKSSHGSAFADGEFVFTEEEETRTRAPVDAATLTGASLEERFQVMSESAPPTRGGRESSDVVNGWPQERVPRPKSTVPWPQRGKRGVELQADLQFAWPAL